MNKPRIVPRREAPTDTTYYRTRPVRLDHSGILATAIAPLREIERHIDPPPSRMAFDQSDTAAQIERIASFTFTGVKGTERRRTPIAS
jgi:hypothetical protein